MPAMATLSMLLMVSMRTMSYMMVLRLFCIHSKLLGATHHYYPSISYTCVLLADVRQVIKLVELFERLIALLRIA